MTLVKTCCASCGKQFYKELRRANEAKKFSWKSYCSPKCQSLAKNKQKIFKCGNPSCGKTFKRSPNEIPLSGVCFCSRFCAALINNSKYPKKVAIKRKCQFCHKTFTGKEKYCSLKCKNKDQTISKEKILSLIREFYAKEGRIPTKQEFIHARAARNRFGSWNKAIKAAGFDPNPVMFAKKHVAFDGDKCDSFAEFIIDNWLSQNKIDHQVHVAYPDSLMSSDFLVEDTRIEFIGLSGEVKRYDQLLEKKRRLIKKQNLKVIEIYPKDLFPKNKLNKILGGIIK